MNGGPQLPLFPEPEPPAVTPLTGKGRERFLSANAAFFDCLVASRTLNTCVTRAAKEAHATVSVGSARSESDTFEVLLRGYMLSDANRAAIARQTIAYAKKHAPDLKLVTVTLEDGPTNGNPLGDIVVRYRTDGRRTVAIATNIKRLAPTTSTTEAGSLLQVLQLALSDKYDPSDPPSPRGYEYDAAIVEWYAGRRKIQDGRDYFLLVARVDNGEAVGLEAWGMLAGVRNGAPIIGRHANRAVVDARPPQSVLDDAMDINAEISAALLPNANPSALRAQLVALIAKAQGHDAARAAAGRLLDVSDEELVARTIAALDVEQ